MELNRVEYKDTYINRSIGCTVHECKYHAKVADFCSLDHIMVKKHEGRAETKKCTDCASFEPEKEAVH